MMVRNGVFMVFLMLAAWQDLKSRQIDLWIFVVFGIAAAAMLVNPGDVFEDLSWQQCLGGGCIGLGLLGMGKMTRGSIGTGDGLFFAVAGMMLGMKRCLLLFGGSVFLCGIYSLIYYSYHRIRHHLRVGKEILPFLPFTALTGICMLWSELKG